MKLFNYKYDTRGSNFILRLKTDKKEEELLDVLYKSITELLEHRQLKYFDLGLPLKLNTQYGSVRLIEECE